MSEGEDILDIKELKKSRAGIKSKITKSCNSIGELMLVEGNVEAVKGKITTAVTGLGEIKAVNDKIRSLLQDDFELEEVDLYFAAVEGSAKEVLNKATAWVDEIESGDNVNEVNPGDSASQVGSRVSSSTEASKRALKAEAKKAALAVEEELLKEQQALELEELSLKQRRETLELRARINAA